MRRSAGGDEERMLNFSTGDSTGCKAEECTETRCCGSGGDTNFFNFLCFFRVVHLAKVTTATPSRLRLYTGHSGHPTNKHKSRRLSQQTLSVLESNWDAVPFCAHTRRMARSALAHQREGRRPVAALSCTGGAFVAQWLNMMCGEQLFIW